MGTTRRHVLENLLELSVPDDWEVIRLEKMEAGSLHFVTPARLVVHLQTYPVSSTADGGAGFRWIVELIYAAWATARF